MNIPNVSHGGISPKVIHITRAMSIAIALTVQALPASANCGQLLNEVRKSIVFVKVVRISDDGSRTNPITGTGFIVTDSGMIITAGHLIPDDPKKAEFFAAVGSRSEHAFPLTYIKKDSQADIALLQLPAVSYGKALPIKVLGEDRMAVSLCVYGFPFEQDLTYAPGNVTDDRTDGGRWQMNAPMNPGFSGGPVLLSTGEAVGMAWGGKSFAQAMTYMVPGWRLKQEIGDIPPPPPPEPPVPVRINISAPTKRGQDNVYPVNLIISATPSKRSLWVVAEDEGGVVWAQRQVRPTQPRFTMPIARTSGFPLSVYIIAVDQNASQAIQRLATNDRAIALDNYEHEIVSNIEIIDR